MNNARNKRGRGCPRVGVILGPSSPAEQVEVWRSCGAGWRTAIDMWRGLEMPYLVLLAHEERRVRAGAPLACMAKDLETLRGVMVLACAQLDDVSVQWFLPLDGDAQAAVREVLLADAAPVGGLQ